MLDFGPSEPNKAVQPSTVNLSGHPDSSTCLHLLGGLVSAYTFLLTASPESPMPSNQTARSWLYTSELGACRSDFTLAIATSYPNSERSFAGFYSQGDRASHYGLSRSVLNQSTSADDQEFIVETVIKHPCSEK